MLLKVSAGGLAPFCAVFCACKEFEAKALKQDLASWLSCSFCALEAHPFESTCEEAEVLTICEDFGSDSQALLGDFEAVAPSKVLNPLCCAWLIDTCLQTIDKRLTADAWSNCFICDQERSRGRENSNNACSSTLSCSKS